MGEFRSGSTFYVTIITDGPQSNQVILFYENDPDIEVIEGISVFMKRKENNQGPFYKFRILGTSAYKWIKFTFFSYFGLSVYVKHGSRPTSLNFDWVWHSRREGHSVHVDRWIIPALDENFNSGDLYIWFKAPDETFYDYDSLLISLNTWNPRYI